MFTNLHRALWLALTILAAGPIGAAGAVVMPVDFTVRDSVDVQAVLVDAGVFIVDEDRALYTCTDLFTPSKWLLWPGREGHALAAGDDGAWLTVQSGCHWRRTTGAVDGKRVVGVLQPDAGAERLVFVIEDQFGGSGVIETVDGGHTSNMSGSLAITGVTLGGIAGRGEAAAVVGSGAEGQLHGWWSADGAQTFQQIPASEHEVGQTLLVAGFAADHVWFWDADALLGLAADGTLVGDAPTFTDGGVVAGDGTGAVWVAARADGLWRRGPDGDWEQRQSEATTVVRYSHERLWIARAAAHEGDPVILRSDDSGETWRTAWAVPGSWDYPDECVSSASQICEDTSTALLEGLGLQFEAEAEAPRVEDEQEATSGCGTGGGRLSGGLLALVIVSFLIIRRRYTWGSP